MRFVFIIAFFGLAICSCGKFERVKTGAPNMVGDWTHLSENDGFHTIYIQENGSGSMFGVNNHGNNQDSQRRNWYIKNDILYFSRFKNEDSEDKFIINLYPTISDTIIALEHDTIPIGTMFMRLNNRVYRKIN